MSYRVSEYFPIGMRGEPHLRSVYLRWGVGSRLPDWDIDPMHARRVVIAGKRRRRVTCGEDGEIGSKKNVLYHRMLNQVY